MEVYHEVKETRKWGSASQEYLHGHGQVSVYLNMDSITRTHCSQLAEYVLGSMINLRIGCSLPSCRPRRRCFIYSWLHCDLIFNWLHGLGRSITSSQIWQRSKHRHFPIRTLSFCLGVWGVKEALRCRVMLEYLDPRLRERDSCVREIRVWERDSWRESGWGIIKETPNQAIIRNQSPHSSKLKTRDLKPKQC